MISEPEYTLYLNKGNTKFSHDLSTGICNFNDVVYGDYNISILDSNGKELYNNIFLINNEKNEIDIYLSEYHPNDPTKNDLILEVRKSYRIECIKDKRLNSIYNTDTITESYYKSSGERGCVLERKDEAGTIAYRPMIKGDFVDIKVKSGELKVYTLIENTGPWEGERDNFNKYFKIVELNHDPLKKYELLAGTTISIDYQYIGNKQTDIIYYLKGSRLSGTIKNVDYYWNNRFGWDIREDVRELKENESYWTSLDEGCIHTYTLYSGNATLYMWYEDVGRIVVN